MPNPAPSTSRPGGGWQLSAGDLRGVAFRSLRTIGVTVMNDRLRHMNPLDEPDAHRENLPPFAVVAVTETIQLGGHLLDHEIRELLSRHRSTLPA